MMGTSLRSLAYMDVGEGREQDVEALPILRVQGLPTRRRSRGTMPCSNALASTRLEGWQGIMYLL